MRLRGKGFNLEAFTECACFLIFGLLLFRLTFTGMYLYYVTPRMKPYLYGLSALMLFWAAVNGKNMLRPKYKSRLHRCLVLIIPILLLAVPPAPPAAGSMIKSYSNANIPIAPTGGSVDASDSTQEADSYDEYGMDGNLEKPDASTDGTVDRQQPLKEETLPDSGLNGLNEETKTITIADEDFYTWMYELGSNADAYQGYTIIMKGFVFLDMEERKENEFALVRLSMWCCSADMSPMGLMTDYEGSFPFKENDWITVTGKIQVTDGYPTIKAENIEAAEKPEEEYVYPYY